MQLFHILSFCLLARCIDALLTEAEYPFIAPGRRDLRSPCPALNAAANHGLLPRSGRDIDLATVGKAVLLGYNMTYETMLVIGIPSLQTSTTGNASTFHLSDLRQHWPQAVDHDASMSREDAYFGGDGKFSKRAWGRTLKSWGDIEIVTIAAAAKELKDRFAYGEKYNPTFNGTFARQPSLLQYGLMMSTFGNTVTGDGNLTLIRYWVEKERLPLEFGWQPSTVELTLPRNQLLAGNISEQWDDL